MEYAKDNGLAGRQLIWLSKAGKQVLNADLPYDGSHYYRLFRVTSSGAYLHVLDDTNGTSKAIRRFRLVKGKVETSDVAAEIPAGTEDAMAYPPLKHDPLGFFVSTASTNSVASILIKRFSN